MDKVLEEKKKLKEKYIKENTPLSIAKAKALDKLFARPRVKLCLFKEPTQLNIMVYEGKMKQIEEAETEDDLTLILEPPSIAYNGKEIVAGNRWVLPVEELIVWANTSISSEIPLSEQGEARYIKLFRECFPEEAEKALKEAEEKENLTS